MTQTILGIAFGIMLILAMLAIGAAFLLLIISITTAWNAIFKKKGKK